MVECMSFYGKPVYIEKNRFSFRPASYGLVLQEGKLLLVNHDRSGKFFFPGGGIGLGDRVELSVADRLRRETGLEVKVLELLQFKESFFYYDPLDQGYHNLSFFYLCEAMAPAALDAGPSPTPEAGDPLQWVAVEALKEDDFHSFGGEIFRSLLRKLAAPVSRHPSESESGT